MDKELIFKAAQEAILQCDEAKAMQVINEASDLKIDPVELLSAGFGAGIREAGDLFGRGELFLPELIFMAEIMKKVTEKIEGSLENKETQKKGRMVIATVAGDVHDIGKGIVCSLVKSNGVEVIDLGREVPVRTIIDKAEEYKADIIGTSTLLTTTMAEQKKLEETLRKEGLRDKYKTIVGGAPCTQRWADKIGADAYAEDAAEAVTKVLALLNK